MFMTGHRIEQAHGYVWKLSTHSVTPPKRGNIDGDFGESRSHFLPLSPFLDTLTADDLEDEYSPLCHILRQNDGM